MNNNLNNPLWNFSLTVYSLPAVASQLLRLQDEYAANVNLLLACCWLAYEGRELTTARLKRAMLETACWSERCIEPLRGVRRYIRGVESKEDFYHQLKNLELLAEQYQQQVLFDVLKDCPQGKDRPDFAQQARENMQRYRLALDEKETADWSELVEGLIVEMAD